MSEPVRIRLAGPDDLRAVVELLRVREEREDAAGLERAVCDLDPARALSWVAFAGDRAVGLTTAFRRDLVHHGRPLRAAYWGNMYIHPAWRDRMLFPRLPLAMFQGLRRAGCDLLYSAIRRERFAQANLKLGCERLGTLPVLAKPLRPAGLLARYRGLPPMAGKLGLPLDLLAGVAWWTARLPRSGRTVSSLSRPEDLDALAALLRRAQGERAGQSWTGGSLAARYGLSWDGEPYHVVGVKAQGRLRAACVYRLARRERGILAGVLMELVYAPGATLDGWRALAAAEWEAWRAGAHTMLHLDGLGPEVRRLTSVAGYLRTPETYQLLGWPKEAVPTGSALRDPTAWRFGFGEHDAF